MGHGRERASGPWFRDAALRALLTMRCEEGVRRAPHHEVGANRKCEAVPVNHLISPVLTGKSRAQACDSRPRPCSACARSPDPVSFYREHLMVRSAAKRASRTLALARFSPWPVPFGTGALILRLPHPSRRAAFGALLRMRQIEGRASSGWRMQAHGSSSPALGSRPSSRGRVAAQGCCAWPARTERQVVDHARQVETHAE